LVTDAWDAAAAVRDGEIAAEQLVSEAFARIDQLDPQVNAFTVLLHEQALERARAIDRRLATVPPRKGVVATNGLPLLGVPVSVKDHIWLAGTPATNGSVAYRDFVPTRDAVGVARLKAAGAVVVGKTNNPEFCYRGYTDNDVWGLTRNPWALDHTPGGSSGGAGASVAYGATPVALGTDGGGSIRIPAAFCGVVGHKPTHGLVPTRPGFRGWPTLSVHGPITRTVRDAALALSVIAGADDQDSLTWPVGLGDLLTGVSRPPEWAGLRVAVSEDLGWAAVEPSVLAAFRRAVDTLADDGARIVEAAPPTPYPVELWNGIALAEGFASEGPLLDLWGDRMAAGTREIVEAGGQLSARQYLDAQDGRAAYTRSWQEFFETHDVLLAPSMPVPAFGVELASPASIDGRPVDQFFDDWCVLALPANLTGQPACAVPTGFDEDGLPVGLQVMGPRWSDPTVLAVAAAYERLAPWQESWPPVVG